MIVWEFTIKLCGDLAADGDQYTKEYAVAETLSEAADLVEVRLGDVESIHRVENISGDRPVWTPEIV